jgi:DNA-3-methyladenine glycosylase
VDSGVGGVLIRAIEPIYGINEMLQNRSINNLTNLTNGPGKLTIALNVDKSLNGLQITEEDSVIQIRKNDFNFIICKSFRIGVTKDLEKELRFYIKENKFVSR